MLFSPLTFFRLRVFYLPNAECNYDTSQSDYEQSFYASSDVAKFWLKLVLDTFGTRNV